MRLIVVSNRVACPKGDEPIDGGLAAALLPAVKTSGAIWVGSSGRLSDPGDKESFVKVQALGNGAVATVDQPRAHYRKFYEGFANSALWPVLHSRTDLIRTNIEHYASYREINALMARAVLRFARPDAMFWIHDYHYFTLGSELRRLGIEQPIGFFLHTPFPNRNIMLSLPHHRDLMRAMLSYDLIGFQTEEDAANFADYLQQELGLPGKDAFTTQQGFTRLATFPIGIDVESFAERAVKSAAGPEISRLRSSLQGAQMVIGVDRVDYSKGLTNRFRAFDRMLEFQPGLKRAVTLLQIAVPSRGQIDAYRHLQAELAALVGEINGRHAEVDWIPIRYLNKGYPQSKLAGFYRTARVGLVTSFNDGMNLVAKEYVAAQNPLDPGALVLSKFAGAARQLDSALLVNPHDIDAVARAISNALAMPGEERRQRWEAMMQTLKSSSLDLWFSEFVSALAAAPRMPKVGVAPDAVAEPPRRRRAELTAIQNY
jgi:trehalose 6-phosphate synthase